MPTSFSELSAAVLALPFESKAELTDRLVISLVDNVPAEIRDAQIAEVMRRREEVLSGKVQLIPAEVVERDIQRLLNEITRVPR